jgi:hypothetical protein
VPSPSHLYGSSYYPIVTTFYIRARPGLKYNILFRNEKKTRILNPGIDPGTETNRQDYMLFSSFVFDLNFKSFLKFIIIFYFRFIS